jgi:hydroxymethylpyrimidine/phosphomethylpyrimidine kinase
VRAAARAISTQFGAKRVLIKGGHLPQTESCQGDEVVDVLFTGGECVEFSARRIFGREVRGTVVCWLQLSQHSWLRALM